MVGADDGPRDRSTNAVVGGTTQPGDTATPSTHEGGFHVALVRPPVVVLPHGLATHGPTPPLGLAYVAAALRANDISVSLVDAPGEALMQCHDIPSPVGTLHRIGLSDDEIVERIPPHSAIIGVTNMFLHEWPSIRALVAVIRERFPRALIIMGGENATGFAPWILDQSDAVDLCVLGEGENTMVELAHRVRAGQPFGDVEGLALQPRHRAAAPTTSTATTSTTGAVASAAGSQPVTLSTGLSPRLTRQELREVPRPAWDLVPLQNYWAHEPFFGVNRGRSMQVLGTRGCPFKCSFCSSPNMWTTRFVTREPADVVDEIAGYVRDFGVENINFVDLTAATNRRWTLGLCDAFEASGLDVRWQLPVGTRTETIDAQVLQRLAETGCKNVTFAPESGSPRMLKIMNKAADLEHILQSVRDGRAAGLRTMINIIVGHPDERWSDLLASVRLLMRAAWAGCDDIAVISFCPYPGSADFERLVSSGQHTVDEEAYYVALSRSSNVNRSWNTSMSPRTVRRLQVTMIGGFYVMAFVRRPSRIVQFLRSMRSGSEDTYLDQMVRTRRTAIKSQGSAPSRTTKRGAAVASPPREAEQPPHRRDRVDAVRPR